MARQLQVGLSSSSFCLFCQLLPSSPPRRRQPGQREVFFPFGEGCCPLPRTSHSQVVLLPAPPLHLQTPILTAREGLWGDRH